jgi:hypothetical protein
MIDWFSIRAKVPDFMGFLLACFAANDSTAAFMARCKVLSASYVCIFISSSSLYTARGAMAIACMSLAQIFHHQWS